MSYPIKRVGESSSAIQLRRFTRITFGLEGPGGIATSAIGMFVLLYYNRVLGVPAGLVGTALALALLFDGISDPLVGYASDKFRSHWGRRHPFMHFAVLPVSLHGPQARTH